VTAESEKREIKDGELRPACAQTCPATAIVFGDLNDPESRVSQLWSSGRGEKLLEDTGAQPKITYLKRAGA
jgi:molybdopterin-containing oxidoreductase family iron-sulfur binding subunit